MLVLMEISDAGNQQGLQVKMEHTPPPTQIYLFIYVFGATSCMKHVTQIQINLIMVSCLINTLLRKYIGQ